MKIKDCMCNDVHCVKPDTKIHEVAKLMAGNHIGCVPVCDDNNCICGIVTDRDVLLRCVACDKDTSKTEVKDIMSCDVCTCKENDDVSQAQNKMSKNQIRRIPICDDNNKIVGILTLGNLAQNDDTIGKGKVCHTLENICDCQDSSNSN